MGHGIRGMVPGTDATDFLKAVLLNRPTWRSRAASWTVGTALSVPEADTAATSASAVCINCPMQLECVARVLSSPCRLRTPHDGRNPQRV